jgi:hypothetical protein
MKRILVFGALAFAISVCHTNWQSSAGEKPSANWDPVTIKLESGDTEKVLVLRIWNSPAHDPKWPQLALLRMSPRAYKELGKDSRALKSFIDGDKTKKPVFDATVTISDGCKLPESDAGDSADDATWVVIVSHRVSVCSCSALRERALPH